MLCKYESFIPRKASGVDIVIVLISQKGRLRHGEVRSVVQAFTAVVSLALAPGSVPSLCSSYSSDGNNFYPHFADGEIEAQS